MILKAEVYKLEQTVCSRAELGGSFLSGPQFTAFENHEPGPELDSRSTNGCAAHSSRQNPTLRAEKCPLFTLFTKLLVIGLW